MTVTRYTLTGDLVDVIGQTLTDTWSARRPVPPVAWLETNLERGEGQITADLGVQLGTRILPLSSGKFTAAGLVASNSADVQPTGIQYRVGCTFRNNATGSMDTWHSGWFNLTANADLKTVAEAAPEPPDYATSPAVIQAEAARVAAETARDQARDISGIDTSDDAIDAALQLPGSKAAARLTVSTAASIATPGAPARAAVASVADVSVLAGKTDPYLLARLDRQNTQAARAGGGSAIIAHADATNWTTGWANLSDVQAAANAQVSNGRLYAVDGANPGGILKSFAIAPGERLHVQTLIYWKVGTGSAIYFGLDTSAAGAAPAASSPDGFFLGLNSSGAFATFRGANLGAVQYNPPNIIGAAPTVDTTYLCSITVDETYVSLALRKLGADDTVATSYVARTHLADAGKSINNIVLFMQDSRGLNGNSFGPVVASKSQQPARTRTVGSVNVEGASSRMVLTSPTLGGDAWRYALPGTYDPRKPSPVVIYCHQSLTGNERSPWSETRAQPLAAALLDAGFILAAANDGGDRWGSPTSVANYLALYSHLRDRYNTGTLFMLGVSMGYSTVLNALSHRTWPTPAAAVSIGGVCNLDDLFAQSAYSPGIKTAYSIAADGSDYESKTAGYRPEDRAGWEFRGVPMRMYTSAGDTAVPKGTGCDALLARVAPYAPGSSVEVKSGGHLDPSQFAAAEIVSFFQSYAA